jgi:hypothetical protein
MTMRSDIAATVVAGRTAPRIEGIVSAARPDAGMTPTRMTRRLTDVNRQPMPKYDT